MDIRTLQYWHKLEHFYPYILQEQKNEYIKTTLVGEDGALPDFLRPELEPGRVVRNYRVYLGIFRVEPAMAALEEGIGRQMRFRDTGEDESCFCTFRLNPDGTVLPDSFQISSFPWAIHRVRDGKINVDQWDDDFLQFQRDIFTILAQREEPVDYPFLLALRETFAQRVNWRIQYCQSWLRIDRVAGRQQQAQGAPGQPGEEAAEEIQAENESTDEQVKKNDLLNSFYIRDLERVIAAAQQGQYPEVLRRFLEHRAGDRVDVEREMEAVFRLMAPKNLPMGRWPSDYGARFMQQVDVNAFLTEDPAYAQPLFSVNGPPGTGKTTLLKDVVAAIVTRRAEALLSLTVPDDAFYPEEEGVVTYRTYSNRIWRLRPAFQEFGILVASNNNGAVENITHGLPGRDGLPDRYEVEEYRYFAEVSDRLLGEGKTWALNAAALGNKNNRQRFVQNLWPLGDDEIKGGYNLRASLREAQKEWEPLMWQEAKARFSAKLREVREEYKVLEVVFAQASELRALRRRLTEREGRLPELAAARTAAEEQLPAAEAACQERAAEQKALEEEVAYLVRTTPLLGLREIFRPNSPAVREIEEKRAWRAAAKERADEARQNRDALARRVEQLREEAAQEEAAAEQDRRRQRELEAQLEAFRQETESPFRLDVFFEENASQDCGKCSPWGYPRLNRLREQLFLEALVLHRAFVEGSRKLYDNLDGFGKLMRGMLTLPQADSHTATLFQSLFLLVPVVSTTFASVGSFLRSLPAGEVAYLFIDEAGQAVPQSAAGAVWRARKVIAVGDPLQIEPVVTLHDAVIEVLSQHFGQDPVLGDKYTSVQTLADRANRLGGWRRIDQDQEQKQDLWIGAPLVVHSRCQRRVFEIANRIAYNDKMIFATRPRPDAVCRWLDVRGSSRSGHYVPAQGEAAAPILAEAFLAFLSKAPGERRYPSAFVITPFRSSRAGLAAHFRRELPRLLAEAGVDTASRAVKSCIREWVRDCVGTIHTFQGKEADTVLLCLGVDSGGRGAGAVEWAGERPNILNVAVTRAKVRLYIIADQEVWCRKGYFRTACELCEKQGEERGEAPA